MAAAGQVVDISADPTVLKRRRRRAIARIGVPVCGLVLVIAAILGIALYADRANRSGALALSDDVLTALDGRIRSQVSAFLDPCARALRIARDLVEGAAMGEKREIGVSFAVNALKEIPQIANFEAADVDGNFLMVHRADAGRIDLKEIVNTPDNRRVTWIHRDTEGREITREDDPKDTYDPRTRPWYTDATSTNDIAWTGVYIFFTDKAPGLTVSTRYVSPDGRLFTFGVDISLKELSHFLAGLRIGQHGQAMIIDGDGTLVAFPDPNRMLKQAGQDLVPAKIDELGDRVLNAVYDRFRIEGRGKRVVIVDGVRYITTASSLQGTGRDWSLLMVVPEADFVGFVASNNRTALAMSMAIVFIAAALTALLVRQGLRADRAARLLLDRSQLITQQSAAYAALAEHADRVEADGSLAPVFTETLTQMTGARRISIWQFGTGGQSLRCLDSHDRESSGHVAGLELHHDELPQFFDLLQLGEEIDVVDAAIDRRTAQFHRTLMHPLGSRSLRVLPLRVHGMVAGAICLEDETQRDGSRDFTRAVASMLALRLVDLRKDQQGRDRTEPRMPQQPRMERSFSADLTSRSLNTPALAATVFPKIAVMVLRLPNQASLAKRPHEDASGLADVIACQLQTLAEKQDIPYLKFVGDEVIAAAGFEPEDETAMLRVADLAVAIRDRCSSLLEEADLPADFRIGIDLGLAIGSAVGREPRLFNLWGEAVRTADMMAGSALPGGIQATEAAYSALQQDFLFRPRGSFYLANLGEARTFILSGQL
ncbi:MAG TPA: cache domain-containing protein [Dongiaceae bacterium]|nr:cache domain-containing protein [Dongiaceae bacterium]